VILRSSVPTGQTDLVVDRLVGAFACTFATEHDLTLGASIGRAVYPADADSAKSLLRTADAATFEAKRSTYQSVPQPARRR
jgi:GGDEF domain-containing protein